VNRDLRSKLEAALLDARERQAGTEASIQRCMTTEQRSWSAPVVLTHRQRWTAVTAEIELLEKLLGAAS
jgi:hypothetical protein